MKKRAGRAFAIEPLQHLLGCAVLALAIQLPANAATLVLDRIYTVATEGSVEPQGIFPIDGPPPVLFIDLPRAAFFTSVTTDWFHDVDPTPSFQVPMSGLSLGDQLWITPSASTWNAHKTSGSWLIDTQINLVNLICAESGGICAPVAGGSTNVTVAFSVSGVVPEPGSNLLLGAGLAAMLGVAALRRR